MEAKWIVCNDCYQTAQLGRPCLNCGTVNCVDFVTSQCTGEPENPSPENEELTALRQTVEQMQQDNLQLKANETYFKDELKKAINFYQEQLELCQKIAYDEQKKYERVILAMASCGSVLCGSEKQKLIRQNWLSRKFGRGKNDE